MGDLPASALEAVGIGIGTVDEAANGSILPDAESSWDGTDYAIKSPEEVDCIISNSLLRLSSECDGPLETIQDPFAELQSIKPSFWTLYEYLPLPTYIIEDMKKTAPLHYAAYIGDISSLRWMLGRDHTAIIRENLALRYDDQIPVRYTAMGGHVEAVCQQ
jgi:hypothetical protein